VFLFELLALLLSPLLLLVLLPLPLLLTVPQLLLDSCCYCRGGVTARYSFSAVRHSLLLRIQRLQ
jgi:hypothetical protein